MGLTARDIMVEEVVCVQETMELDALMKLFVDRRLRGVPVLDEDGFSRLLEQGPEGV